MDFSNVHLCPNEYKLLKALKDNYVLIDSDSSIYVNRLSDIGFCTKGILSENGKFNVLGKRYAQITDAGLIYLQLRKLQRKALIRKAIISIGLCVLSAFLAALFPLLIEHFCNLTK